jgi:hypothetical protein
MRVSQNQTHANTWGRGTMWGRATTWGRTTTWGRRSDTTWGR